MMNDFVFVSTIQTSLTFKGNQTFLIFNPPYCRGLVLTKFYTLHILFYSLFASGFVVPRFCTVFILIILFWICTHKMLYPVFLDISCTGTKINSKVAGHHFKGLEGLGRKSYITNGAISSAELQKDYFCPVSWFSNEKCPNYVFGEIYHNVRHKRKHRLVVRSFIVIWNWNVWCINTILSF